MHRTLIHRCLQIAYCIVTLALCVSTSKAADELRVGFGKVDVTPTESVRLSGYATRDKGHTDVADRLFARACVLTKGHDDASTMVLVSIDSIAVTGEMTKHVGEVLMSRWQLPRSQIVICSTHSHAAPHTAGGLTNLYKTPLSAEESAALERNNKHMEQGIVAAVESAMQARQAATLHIGESSAGFAVNRRVLQNGLWKGFGIQADGVVDRRVRVLKAIGVDGKLLGAAYLYACHCTTLGPDFNQVSGDWAGLSATTLETSNPGAIFLPVIGCGADANPEPRRNYEDAKNHAAEMVQSVSEALIGAQTAVTDYPVGHFGYAGLAPEHPTRADLQAQTQDKDVTRRRWAEQMLATWDKMGRLPETYPAPLHTWQFGNVLTWVFMGGEVVVDYQRRLEREIDSKQVWVAAYTDDVFAYVASERMRAEGGYEVDFSMLYYNQPGRWQSGTEDLISKRVAEILKEKAAEDKPKDALGALKSIRLPDGFSVDLMAAEPAVADPVNIAFGHDGRVWVVEMTDYPLGSEHGGDVKWLRDADGDGRYEESHVFVDELAYPTSVLPWRSGVIIVAAPEIFYAEDTDGDGKADKRETLLTGIGEANPQHRAGGFEIGLDGLVHFTSGDGTRELKSTRNGQVLNVAGRDVAWNPDTGELFTTSGHTQFVRARDEFGNWFGNVNNQPMFHYVIEDRYRGRGTASGPALQHLLTPGEAPPVYPASRTLDRFNDLFTLNRFTSACSSIIVRVPGLGERMRGAALVCEPVHNLVARFQVERLGSTFRGERFAEDSQVDWFASADTWSRPVRVVNAPDGTIWIADMVRQVIEHPEWIPIAWQERLNVRAGAGLGRIYRVRSSEYKPSSLPNAATATDDELLKWITSDNGALRDMAAMQLIWRSTGSNAKVDHAVGKALREAMHQHADAAVRVQCLGCLVGMNQADESDYIRALNDLDARVRRWAMSAAEPKLATSSALMAAVIDAVQEENDAGARVQDILSLGGVENDRAGSALRHLAVQAAGDRWAARALSLVINRHVADCLNGLVDSFDHDQVQVDQAALPEIEASFSKLWQRAGAQDKVELIRTLFTSKNNKKSAELDSGRLMVLSAIGGDAELLKLTASDETLKSHVAGIGATAQQIVMDESQPMDKRVEWMPLLRLNADAKEPLLSNMKKLLEPNQPPAVQFAVVSLIRRLNMPESADVLITAWPHLAPELRTAVTSLLLDKRNWSGKLLAAIESGAIKPSDLDAAAIQRMRSYGDRTFMSRIETVLGKPSNSDRAKLVESTLAKLTKSGDHERGAALFKQHCAVCHRSQDKRPLVGPPLENLKSWNDLQWVTAVLDPNKAIEPKYHQYAVQTTAGQTLAGLIEDRSASSLTLVGVDGVRHELLLSDIETLKDLGISVMPEGLETKINQEGLADLLAYLKTLPPSGQ
ncbi:MAG: neutral/alkaline non-lysosomal ceramidase N-terminal domain-containing protein [Pirellulales bacterium]